MAKKPESRKSNAVNLLFKCPVGKSVPGGPFYPDREYQNLGPEVYNHPLIKGLITQGLVMVLSDIETQTGTVLMGSLDDATKKAYAAAERAEAYAKKAEEAHATAEEALAAIKTALGDGDDLSAEESAETLAAAAAESKAAAENAVAEAASIKK